MILLFAAKLDLVKHFVMLILMALAPYYHGEILNSYDLVVVIKFYYCALLSCFMYRALAFSIKDFYGMTLMK